VEEARHLVFGRHLVRELWRAQCWDAQTVADVRGYLAQFIVASWREYYNPDVYADAGLADPWELAETAWQSPHQRAHRRAVTSRCLSFLIDAEILTEEPASAF
jgi:hypothetical protein